MAGNITERNPIILEIRELVKSYGNIEVLRGVNMEIRKGETTTIIGRSGSGKSTLLRCIALLEEFQSGDVFLNGKKLGYFGSGGNYSKLKGKALALERAKIGMVFQNFNLFPHLTVLENVIEAPLHVKRVSSDSAIAHAEKLLKKIQLYDRAQNYPATLSGGEQQRVAIARALAMEPDVLLFDEPTSSLDPELTSEVLEVMRELADDGVTMLVVTHEMSFARDASSEVVFIDEGTIVERGAPEKVFTEPSDSRTRQFLRSMLDNSV